MPLADSFEARKQVLENIIASLSDEEISSQSREIDLLMPYVAEEIVHEDESDLALANGLYSAFSTAPDDLWKLLPQDTAGYHVTPSLTEDRVSIEQKEAFAIIECYLRETYLASEHRRGGKSLQEQLGSLFEEAKSFVLGLLINHDRLAEIKTHIASARARWQTQKEAIDKKSATSSATSPLSTVRQGLQKIIARDTLHKSILKAAQDLALIDALIAIAIAKPTLPWKALQKNTEGYVLPSFDTGCALYAMEGFLLLKDELIITKKEGLSIATCYLSEKYLSRENRASGATLEQQMNLLEQGSFDLLKKKVLAEADTLAKRKSHLAISLL